SRDIGAGDQGDGYEILADSSLQRRVVRRAPVSAGQRALAHLRRHAYRQSFPWLVFSPGRLFFTFGDLDPGLMGPRTAGCRLGNCRAWSADGADLLAAAWV